jgi:hypothetical protein
MKYIRSIIRLDKSIIYFHYYTYLLKSAIKHRLLCIGVFSGVGSMGNVVGRWYVLNTTVLGYALFGDMGVLYAYMYISLGGGVLRMSSIYLVLMDSC